MSGWTRSEGTGDLKEVGLPWCIGDLQNIRWCKSALILQAVELTSSSLTCKILVLISSSGVWDEREKFLYNGNGIWMAGELVAFWFKVFVTKLPGPLAMHIAAFTGLYHCRFPGGTAMCSLWIGRSFGRTRFGGKRFARQQIDGCISQPTPGHEWQKLLPLSGGRHGNYTLLSGMQYLRLAATIQQTHQSENNL
jgi:hypothetical protein